MVNYKMIIQYDGTKYRGWQRLGNTENTIQGKIENVLSKMLKREIQIIGCSRTDAGVHALYQVANFIIDENKKVEEIQTYLNHYLPNDISIIEVKKVQERFHSRHNAGNKTYVYKIWNREYSNPFLRKYSYHIKEKLDIEKIKIGAKYFVGEHDFTAFTSAQSKKKTMIRRIDKIEIGNMEGMYEIRVTGNGFLHNMVRRIVGALIEIGFDRFDAKQIPDILKIKKSTIIGKTVPGCGLFLESIEY
jgi:tRNA pseudouridine38-40 synthase